MNMKSRRNCLSCRRDKQYRFRLQEIQKHLFLSFFGISCIFIKFRMIFALNTLRTTYRQTLTKMTPQVMVQELTLQCSDGIQIAAQCWSSMTTNENKETNSTTPAQKHRILCLHGWMDNCRSFHHLAPAVVDHYSSKRMESPNDVPTSFMNCQVVALDLPGHGLSSHKSMDGPPTLLAESVFYVNEALHQLNWMHETVPFTLIGHSMGAAIGCVYAAAFPEQVDKLVLLDGGGPMARNSEDAGKHIRQHVLRRRLGLQQNKAPRIYNNLQEAVATRCQTAKNFPGNQYLSEIAAEEMVRRGTKTVGDNGTQVQFIHDPRLQWPSAQFFTNEQVEGIYNDIHCPTGLFLAEEGWPLDPTSLQRSINLLRPVITEKLPGSHHFHADPDTAPKVADSVIKFITIS